MHSDSTEKILVFGKVDDCSCDKACIFTEMWFLHRIVNITTHLCLSCRQRTAWNSRPAKRKDRPTERTTPPLYHYTRISAEKESGNRWLKHPRGTPRGWRAPANRAQKCFSESEKTESKTQKNQTWRNHQALSIRKEKRRTLKKSTL